jgi:hypothetical protein
MTRARLVGMCEKPHQNRVLSLSALRQFHNEQLFLIFHPVLDWFVPVSCSILQYADVILVYSSCTSDCVLFTLIGATISSAKPEVVLFSRKHLQLPVSFRIINDLSLPQSMSFEYFVVYFNAGLDEDLWRGVFREGTCKDWGPHLCCMVLLRLKFKATPF